MTADDSLLAITQDRVSTPDVFISSAHPPILSMQIGEKLRLPLKFQERQGGIPFWSVQIFIHFFGTKWGVWAHRVLLYGFVLFGVGLLLFHYFSPMASFSALIFLALDPLSSFAIIPGLTENLMIGIFFLLMAILIRQIQIPWYLFGLLFIFALHAKVTLLWYLIAVLPFIGLIPWTKRTKLYLFSCFFFFSFYVWTIDPTVLLARVEDGKSFAAPLIHYPYREFWNALFNPVDFLAPLYDTEYPLKGVGMGWSYFRITISGVGLLLWFGVHSLVFRKNMRKKKIFYGFSSLLLFFLAANFTLTQSMNWAEYFFHFNIVLAFLFAKILNLLEFKPRKWMVLSFVALLCIRGAQIAEVYSAFRAHKPLPWLDHDFLEHVLTEVPVREIHIAQFTLLEQLDFVSGGRVNTISHTEEILRGEYPYFVHLLRKIGEGKMILDLTDWFSALPNDFKIPRSLESLKIQAEAANIEISNSNEIKRTGKPTFLYFEFKSRGR